MSKEKFTFFWNGPFSQWDTSPFLLDVLTYSCAEQYMMARKAVLFKDHDTHMLIMNTQNPKQQKAYGRHVKNFDLEKWNAVARDIVYKGNYAKFTQNEKHKKALLATAGTTIVEASPYDKIWGIGLYENDPKALDRNTWNGLNWLGETLTKVREQIIQEERR